MKRNLQIQIEDDEPEEKKIRQTPVSSRIATSPMKSARRPAFGTSQHIEML